MKTHNRLALCTSTLLATDDIIKAAVKKVCGRLRDGELQRARQSDLRGHGDKKDAKPMVRQIDDMEKSNAGGKSGAGWFDRTRQQPAACIR